MPVVTSPRGGIVILSIITCLLGVVPDDVGDFQLHQPPLEVWAAVGTDASLPCDVSAPLGDRVNMVLWFKDSTGVPLYSLDARQKDLSSAVHWSIATPLGSRAYFLSGGSVPAHLLIKDVRLEDEGVFRCRVDFVSSPTRNCRLNLTVIEALMPPIVFDGHGKEVIGVAGPFLEGYELFLACHVRGSGRRLLEATWWLDDELLDGVAEISTDSLTINRLFVPNVNRTLWERHLQCRAKNSNLAAPVVRDVPLEVFLKPRTVNIVTENVLLSSGKPHTFQCESSGSVPSARVIWLLDGEPIRRATVSVSETSTTTTSMLSFVPVEGDDGKELVCRAENSLFLGGMLEERRHIQVAYPPIVSVHFETNTDTESLKEGDDVILVCDVRANPQPRTITWHHEERKITNDEASGLQTLDRTLRLTPLVREMSGEYSCAAFNEEGATRSTPLFLRVQFSPRCRQGHASLRVGALLHQSVTVSCEVDADPGADDVRFSWTYNRSRDVFPIPGFRVTSVGVVSRLDYTPTSEDDYGTLACWASNSIGRQTTPCYVHVVPPVLPHPPEHCVLRNRSSGGLEVACAPGFDGELPQHFLLEVSESPSDNEVGLSPRYLGPPLYHVLGSEPVFALHSLEPGVFYQAAVFAVNAKGVSRPPVLIPHIKVPERMERLTGPDSVEDKTRSLEPVMIVLAVLIGVAVLIICVICTTLQVVRRRQSSASGNKKTRDAERAACARSRDRSESIEMQKREMARWSGLGFLDEGGGANLTQFQTRNEPDLIFSRNEVFVRSVE